MTNRPIQGFMLLRPATTMYRGVDRDPFEPEVGDDAHAVGPTERVSDLYPAGWKKSLYRHAEAKAVSQDLPFLFASLGDAVQIRRQLAAHVGAFEIVWARISPSRRGSPAGRSARDAEEFLGYDVAYLGGDFYSAVRNGLWVNPDRALWLQFGGQLNRFGLFSTPEAALSYLSEFRRTSLTESASEFHLYELGLVPGDALEMSAPDS